MNKLLYRSVGRFYLGEASQQAQYVFEFRGDAPKELKRSFLIELDKDNDFKGNALEVALGIKEIIDSYWINTDKERINAVVEYLRKWNDKDIYEGLIVEREALKSRLETVEYELSLYEEEETA